MASLGQRLKAALDALADPTLRADLNANIEGDAAQAALLDTLGTRTTALAADAETIKGQVAALQTAIDNLPAGTDTTALQAKLDELTTKVDDHGAELASLDEAFPDAEQATDAGDDTTA